MSLNRSEWTKAQDLLLKLVNTLQPLTETDHAKQLAALDLPFSVNKQLFVPPSSNQENPFRHTAHLLTALQTAKSQVDQWTNGPAPTPAREPSRSALGPTAKNDSAAPKPEKPLETVTAAHRLIVQVRMAIQSLSTSAHLVAPKKEPLRDALKKLKPFIDDMIEAVTFEGTNLGEEKSPYSRFMVPNRSEEALLKKEIPFLPVSPRREKEAKPITHARTDTKAKADKPEKGSESKVSSLSERQENTASAHPQLNQEQEMQPLIRGRTSSQPSKSPLSESYLIPEGKQAAPSQERGETPVIPDRVVLPGAPFTPQMRLNLLKKEKKKRRKGLWDKDPKEDA